jgi:uncharacterized protein (TIGR02246 family)
MTMKCFAIVVVLLGLGTAPGHSQRRTVPALDALLADLVTAFNARDFAKLASFYADDAVWMPPDTPMIRGRANIEATFKKAFERTGVLKLTVSESEVADARAVAMGTYTVTISLGTPASVTGARGGGGTLVFPAKFLTVFKRIGNDWKIAYDMQNADQPPPAQ